MQVKRDVVHPDPAPTDADGELQLPGKLVALGEQLHADAARLAEVYPADFYDRMIQHELVSSDALLPAKKARHRTNKLALVVLAAALLLLIGIPAAYLVVRPAATEPVAGENRRQPSTVHPAPLPAFIATHPRPHKGALMMNNPSPADPHASLLYKVSGPELDGWLDVLEQSESGTTTLSM